MQNLVDLLSQFTLIVTHLPTWVYLAFAYGVFMGVRALWERKISLYLLVVLPLVFLGLSVSSLVSLSADEAWVVVVYLLALVPGLWVGGSLSYKAPLAIDRGGSSLRLAGSAQTLVLFVLLFLAKFLWGSAVALHNPLSTDPVFISVVFGVSGLNSGIVTGRTARHYLAFRKSRELVSN